MARKKNGQKKQAIQKLANATNTKITTKPDKPEPDEAFLPPPPQPTPFENAVAEFDPERKRGFFNKLREAAKTATAIASRVEEARQLSAQIDTLKSEFLTPEAIEAAKTPAAAALKLLDAALKKAEIDRAEMDRTFLLGLPKAKAAQKPHINTIDAANATAKRLKQDVALRDLQEAELRSSMVEAEKIAAAWPAVEKAADAVKAALAKLSQAIQNGLNEQTRIAAQAEGRRQLEASARQSVLKAEQLPIADLLKRAAAAKVVVPDPKIADMVVAASEAVKGAEWALALKTSQEFLSGANVIKRALSRALAAKETYDDESARVFKALVQVTSDQARLKIKSVGPFADLKKFEDAATSAAKAKNWPDAMTAIGKLDDCIEKANLIFPKFDHYLTGAQPMLLKTTFEKVVALPSLKTNEDILAKLATVYEQQCNVVAENWRQHLGYYPAFKGPFQDHYSTFWDSIAAASVTVHKQTAGSICNQLFNGVSWTERIHATYVLNNIHHHKYWGGLYSGSVQLGWENGVAANHPEVVAALDAQYQTMAAHMSGRVQDAIAKHGRVGAATLGPTVT